MIASHIGVGLGRFLFGVFTGELLDEMPWPTNHSTPRMFPHGVAWMDAVFVGDPDRIPSEEPSVPLAHDCRVQLRTGDDGPL